MCGRFALHTPRSRIAYRYFDIPLPVGDVHAKYNITPGTQITSVLATPDDSASFEFSHWGFRPPWAKEDAPTPINIRTEKAATSPYFRSAFAHRRCLIPANGWYEWRKTESGKQPYYITLKDPDRDEVVFFAVLWEPAGARDGDLLRDPDRTRFSSLCVHPRPPAGGVRSRVSVAVAGSGTVGP